MTEKRLPEKVERVLCELRVACYAAGAHLDRSLDENQGWKAANAKVVEAIAAEIEERERALAEIGSILEWVQAAANGEQVSDFAESFPLVATVKELREKDMNRAACCAHNEARATAAEAEAARLREALRTISDWKLPPATDHDGEPCSYGSAYGSNGERDFMRAVARLALGEEIGSLWLSSAARAALSPADKEP